MVQSFLTNRDKSLPCGHQELQTYLGSWEKLAPPVSLRAFCISRWAGGGVGWGVGHLVSGLRFLTHRSGNGGQDENFMESFSSFSFACRYKGSIVVTGLLAV